MRPHARFSAAIYTSLLFCFLCFLTPAGGAENISESNRMAFELKVKELLKTEFFEVVRGRAKPKPMRVNDAAEIQGIVRTGTELFQSLYSDFLESERLLEKAFLELPSYIPEKEALLLKQQMQNQIHSLVFLHGKIKTAKTFYELKKTLDYSRLQLMLMPVKVSLLKKLMRDFDLLSGKKASQFPEMYREASAEYLKKIYTYGNEAAGDIFSFDAELSMKQFTGFLSQLEFSWLEKSQQTIEEKNVLISQDKEFKTAALRAQDGVVVVYGDEKSLNLIVEQLKQSAKTVLLARDVEAFIQGKNIPGVQRVESFYFYESGPAEFLKDSVRSAELQDAFPLFEGLDQAQAKMLLNAFGYEAEVLENCSEKTMEDIREVMKGRDLHKYRRVVFLCGTDADSILFSVWQ